MKDKLVIEESRQPYGYRMWWFLAEEQELGGCVGESRLWNQKSAPKDREAWECWAIENAVHKSGASHDSQGFWWESKSEALKALRLAKEALKQDRPLPEWARLALEEGWKPPKGWKA